MEETPVSEMDKLLGHYRDMWVELNSINDLRAKLEERARDIHARQRQLANKIAALSDPDA